MFLPDTLANERTVRGVKRGWAVSSLVLFSSSARLWIGHSEFPQIPLFRFMTGLPHWFLATIDATALLAAAVSVGIVLVNVRKTTTTSFGLFVLSLATLFLTNQHRLQPWAYLLSLFAFILASCTWRLNWNRRTHSLSSCSRQQTDSAVKESSALSVGATSWKVRRRDSGSMQNRSTTAKVANSSSRSSAGFSREPPQETRRSSRIGVSCSNHESFRRSSVGLHSRS